MQQKLVEGLLPGAGTLACWALRAGKLLVSRKAAPAVWFESGRPNIMHSDNGSFAVVGHGVAIAVPGKSLVVIELPDHVVDVPEWLYSQVAARM
jgi:hypothetical protein